MMIKYVCRTLGVTAVGLATMFVAGCGLLEPTENTDNVSIVISSIDTLNIVAGSPSNTDVTITLTGENERPTITSVSVTNSAGGVASGVTATLGTVPSGDEVEYEVPVILTVASSACNGDYNLVVEATSGTDESTKKEPFSLTGNDCGTSPIVLIDTTVTLGSWKNNEYGSGLDVDAMVVYEKAEIEGNSAIVADLDLYYATDSDTLPKIWNPDAAVGAGYLSASNVANPPVTKFVKVSGVNFDDITTQSEIDDLWTGSGLNSLLVEPGNLIVVQSTENTNVLLEIVSTETGTHTGTARVKGYK